MTLEGESDTDGQEGNADTVGEGEMKIGPAVGVAVRALSQEMEHNQHRSPTFKSPSSASKSSRFSQTSSPINNKSWMSFLLTSPIHNLSSNTSPMINTSITKEMQSMSSHSHSRTLPESLRIDE